jgi:hypothetical protein
MPKTQAGRRAPSIGLLLLAAATCWFYVPFCVSKAKAGAWREAVTHFDPFWWATVWLAVAGFVCIGYAIDSVRRRFLSRAERLVPATAPEGSIIPKEWLREELPDLDHAREAQLQLFRVRPNPAGAIDEFLETWDRFRKDAIPGDTVWTYSAPHAPGAARLHTRSAGYALVRNGIPVAVLVISQRQ